MNRYFTANYINADSNFGVFNLPDIEIEGKERSIVCILLNILQRGCPTRPSKFLSKQIRVKSLQNRLHILSDSIPDWGELIKGGTNNYPARTFLYEIVPQYFSERPYLGQLFIPEVLISDILPDDDNQFERQQVDFYLPQAKVIVEIDGYQHNNYSQSALDKKRDKALMDAGIHVVRIPAKSINERDSVLRSKISEIKRQIERNRSLFDEYDQSYRTCKDVKGIEDELIAICTIRLQITILELLLTGVISLTDEAWRFRVRTHEVSGYEKAAIMDLMIWLNHLLTLAGVDHKMPKVMLEKNDSGEKKPTRRVSIELSAFTIATPENTKDTSTVFAFSTADRLSDFFRICVADPIAYDLEDADGETADVLNPKRKALKALMTDIFGHTDYRPGQERIVINALQRKNTIGILPTGSGKSLCYQLCALLQPGLCICVCPIKSLMIDQNDELNDIGISRTAFISSDLSPQERKETQRRFSEGKYLITFMSPERFQDESFREFLWNMVQTGVGQFSYATIDEVHCLSEWGHSFRVSYLNLVKTIKKYCPSAVIIGLTATASFRVIKNILMEFEMEDREDVISSSSFDRPELDFHIEQVNNGNKQSVLFECIDGFRYYHPNLLDSLGNESKCGIVFTPHVNGKYGCVKVASALANRYGTDVRAFSGQPPKAYSGSSTEWDVEKRRTQKEFKGNKFTLLAATKAFGMGINKPNIRYTIHYGIPESLEALYQEAGRAGRDRKKAQCLVIYTKERPGIEKLLKSTLERVDVSVDEVKKVVKDIGFDGEDLYRQTYLFCNGLVSEEDEIHYARSIILGLEDGHTTLQAQNQDELDIMQKVVYHLSIIGIIEDWTVDWKAKALKLYVSNYNRPSLIRKTLNYICAYEEEQEEEYRWRLNSVGKYDYELSILRIFWEWYYNNIVYSRKQALLTVDEACSKFAETNDEKEFRRKMEAYFRIDDVVDSLGEVADNPREYKRWFKIIDNKCIKKNTANGIIMRLNRFLESYKQNTGLNYISGVLNLINHSFESVNGRTKLEQALSVINTMEDDDKRQILSSTAEVIATVGDDAAREMFVSYFIDNYDFDGVERTLYKKLEDDYSLSVFMKKIMVNLIEGIGA